MGVWTTARSAAYSKWSASTSALLRPHITRPTSHASPRCQPSSDDRALAGPCHASNASCPCSQRRQEARRSRRGRRLAVSNGRSPSRRCSQSWVYLQTDAVPETVLPVLWSQVVLRRTMPVRPVLQRATLREGSKGSPAADLGPKPWSVRYQVPKATALDRIRPCRLVARENDCGGQWQPCSYTRQCGRQGLGTQSWV